MICAQQTTPCGALLGSQLKNQSTKALCDRQSRVIKNRNCLKVTSLFVFWQAHVFCCPPIENPAAMKNTCRIAWVINEHAGAMLRSHDYPVLQSSAEVDLFFRRCRPFVERAPEYVAIELVPVLDRIGTFVELAEAAGEFGAVHETLDELTRAAFGAGSAEIGYHLVVFPNGWVALTRHFDNVLAADEDAEHPLRVGVVDTDGTAAPASADLRRALVDVLVGSLTMRESRATSIPLLSRRKAPWSEELHRLIDRDALESAFAGAVEAQRADGPPPARPNIVDEHLKWFAKCMTPPPAAPVKRRPARRAPARPARIDLRDHVINLEMGELSGDGEFVTTELDVAAIARSAVEWARKADGRAIVIYGHGGLVSERNGLAYARQTAPWWLANECYPIFCVWESDALSAIGDLIGDVLGPERLRGARGPLSELRDRAVEALAHETAAPVWSWMKRSAKRASADGERHGLTLLARELKGALGTGAIPPVHLVGHSAGAIMHLHFLERLVAEGIEVATMQALAPAATTRLFRDVLDSPALAEIPCRLYAMTDVAERADDTVPGYGKSLLYLVSRGFERVVGEPIAGLQKDLTADHALMRRLASGFSVPREAVVFSPTPEGAPPRLSSHARTHGAFDDDPATMFAVMHLIRGPDEAQTIEPFPELGGQARGASPPPALPPEVATYRALVESVAMPPRDGAREPGRRPAAVVARSSGLKALSIGIDAYRDAFRLHGCVNDSNAWSAQFERRGFAVTQRVQPEELGRANIIDELTQFIDGAGSGETLVFHYSGHGTTVGNADAPQDDPEYSGLDQAIVASDAQTGPSVPTLILDDELHRIFSRLNPQARLFVFMDCCFSGTATRLRPSGRVRTIGPVRRRNHVSLRRALTAPAPENNPYEGTNHVLFAASSPLEFAEEDGSPPLGVFTRAAIEVLDGPTGPMTNEGFARKVFDLMRGRASQQPDIWCDSARRAEPFPLL